MFPIDRSPRSKKSMIPRNENSIPKAVRPMPISEEERGRRETVEASGRPKAAGKNSRDGGCRRWGYSDAGRHRPGKCDAGRGRTLLVVHHSARLSCGRRGPARRWTEDGLISHRPLPWKKPPGVQGSTGKGTRRRILLGPVCLLLPRARRDYRCKLQMLQVLVLSKVDGL